MDWNETDMKSMDGVIEMIVAVVAEAVVVVVE